MPMYRKKPVVIEAIQWTGSNTQIIALWADPALTADKDLPEGWRVVVKEGKPARLIIPTLEGDHEARIGDMIIKGVAGEFYPCKPDIFAATYEPA